jgi:uncharacterized membrane protein YkvA (DUF1232 family)
MWQDLLLTLGAGIVVSWLTLLIALLLARPKGPMLAEAMRLMPDLLRLLRRLAADRNLPRGVHARLVLLLVYLALPVDLVPDFVPVVGYADDAIIVAAVLRAVVRRAGIEAVRAHWPGTDSGFAALARLTGLYAAGAGNSARMRSPDGSQGAQVPGRRRGVVRAGDQADVSVRADEDQDVLAVHASHVAAVVDEAARPDQAGLHDAGRKAAERGGAALAQAE